MKEITTGTRLIAAGMGLVMVVSVFAGIHLLGRPDARPDIEGVLLRDPAELPDFRLTDHRNHPFTRDELRGDWHLLSYGFTHCPDICPATLNVLGRIGDRLDERGQYNDLELLFYSVDPLRDTPEHLAEYVRFFHPDMTGLTRNGSPDENHEPFEEGLGIVSRLPEEAQSEDAPQENYSVSHGVMLFLLNPEGKLQAVFSPTYNEDGRMHFSVDRLLEDYLAVRHWVDGA